MFKFLALGLCLILSSLTHATIVQFQTSLGTFEVNLFDQRTPETVENFLQYVGDQAYNDSLIHRRVNGFVVQGGGFSLISVDDFPGSPITTNAPVANEPVFSNVRGTIAMAKLGGNPNSATSQWFFNLGDNSANLDNQNGGFTVFGQVMDEGMAVVDAIGALADFDFSSDNGAYSNIPLRDYTDENFNDDVTPDGDNVMLINAIVVLNAAVDTAVDIEPVLSQATSSSGDGGGSGDTLFLALLVMLGLGVKGRSRLRQ